MHQTEARGRYLAVKVEELEWKARPMKSGRLGPRSKWGHLGLAVSLYVNEVHLDGQDQPLQKLP